MGAINTLLVLPLAFEDFPQGWGLLKVMTAYALILAQFFSLGAPNIMTKYMPQSPPEEHGKLNLLTLLLTTAGAFILCLGYWLFRDTVLGLINPENSSLLAPELTKLLLLSIVLGYFYLFGGYLTASLSSVFYTFMNESFLKITYLLLALGYLFEWFSFEFFINAFVLSYTMALAMVIWKAISKGYAISWNLPQKAARVLEYGLFTIMDKGAGVIVNSLDIVMIGYMLNLEEVAYYTLAFYIGSVVMIPQKALVAITGPLMSMAIKDNDHRALAELYSKSALHQLIAGGFIFVCIWVNIDPIMSLMPAKFSGGKWVVFYIGLSKIFYLLSANNSAILVYSKYFRVNLYFSLMLVAVTIMTNALMIPIWGIDGAAAATAIAFFFFTINRTWFVYRKFGLLQFDKKVLQTAAVLTLAAVGIYFVPAFANAWVVILSKGILVSAVMLIYLLLARPSAELHAMFQRWLPVK